MPNNAMAYYNTRMTIRRRLYACVSDPPDLLIEVGWSEPGRGPHPAVPVYDDTVRSSEKQGRYTDFHGRTATVGHARIHHLTRSRSSKLTPFLSMQRLEGGGPRQK